MKPQEKQFDEKNYRELNMNPQSEYSEVFEIIPKENEADFFQIDTILKKIFINSFYKPVDGEKSEIKYNTIRLDLFGNSLSTFEAHSNLKEGSMWNYKYYVNWLINSDTTKYDYIEPLSKEELKDSEKWLDTFLNLYKNATDVYIDNGLGDYYFKIEDKWHKLGYNKIANSEFNKKYPERFKDIRMVELKDQFPDLYVSPAERDTSLIKQIKYTSTFFEKSDRGDAFNYSAGWWYFDIYMPGGDTLKIKRFASFRDPEMKLYKIPKELGGREDVLFIIQEPNEIHPEQVGGMYVIRPKNYKETPQYKEQEAKELEKEKERKQKESQKAVMKRRSFLPEEK